MVYKFIRDYYLVWFLEFEMFIINLLEYVKVVVCFGNGLMDLDSIKGFLELMNNILGVFFKKVFDGFLLMIVIVEVIIFKG